MVNSGIYQLKSKSTGKVYVGLTGDLKTRKRSHLNYLKKHKHYNKYLQRNYNKYGKEDLVFSVLECCEEKFLEEREIFWIKELDACNKEKGFNFSEGGNLKNYNAKKYNWENVETGEILINKSVLDLIKHDARSWDRSDLYKVIKKERHSTHGWKIKGRTVFRRKSPARFKPIKLINIKTLQCKNFVSQSTAGRFLKVIRHCLSTLQNDKKRRSVKGWTTPEKYELYFKKINS